MGQDNWDAALVIRANELLTEVRRYHVDAEATRLQLASLAASVSRKVDDLPIMVRQLVDESLLQDSLKTELPLIAKRLDLSTRMLNDLSEQFHSSGLSFLRQARWTSAFVVLACIGLCMMSTFWVVSRASEAKRLSSEIGKMQKTIDQLRHSDRQGVVKTCIGST